MCEASIAAVPVLSLILIAIVAALILRASEISRERLQELERRLDEVVTRGPVR